MVQLEKTDEERRDKVEERRNGAVQCCGAELKQVKSRRAEGCKGAMKEGRLCGVCGVHRVAAPSIVDKILIRSLADSLSCFEHSHTFTPTDKLIISLIHDSPVA